MMPLALLRQYRRVYLASPYSFYGAGHAKACADVSKIAGDLIAEGVRLFSPIAHSHTIAEHSELNAFSRDLWMDQDEAWMEVCDALVIVELPGWENSFGVAQEADYFRDAEKPVHRLNPITMELR